MFRLIPGFRYVVCIVLLVLVSACGFQLRGYDMQGEGGLKGLVLKSLALTFADEAIEHEWQPLLSRQLSRFQVTVSEQAPVTLHLTKVRSNKGIVAYDSRGKAAEYELHHGLTFVFYDAQDRVLLGPDTVDSKRVYTFDQNRVSGKNQEERLLLREMRAEILQKLMRYLNRISQLQNSVEHENKT